MIIGLDISTSIVGYTILKNDASFHEIGFIDLRKLEIVDKIKKFKNVLRHKLQSDMLYEDWQVFVEAPLQRSNNQFTTNKLQYWNGLCCGLLYELAGTFPTLITEVNARKANNIVIPKGVKGKEKKRFCLQWVQNLDIVPKEVWKLNRANNPADGSYDMADSFIVAKAGHLNEIR